MSCPQKNKGKGYEREVCDIFKDAYNLNFQRIPNSGAFIGGKNFTRMASMSGSQILLSKGDIIPPDELPNLIIECKARKEFQFHLLLTEEHKELNKWITQVEIDWNVSGKKGLYFIIFKPNRRGDYAVFQKSLIQKTKFDYKNYISYWYDNREFIITKFDKEFLLTNKETIFKLCGK